jgi:hypothetical protein
MRVAGAGIVVTAGLLIALGAAATRESVAAEGDGRDVAVVAAARLEATYVFPARAHEAADLLRRNADSGAYDNLQTSALAGRLTSDIGSILHDKHVRVLYRGAPGAPLAPVPPPAPSDRDMLYGLAQVSHLAGNVGYIDLRGFVRASPESGRVLDAAMNALASSDAIILDLRKNGGGDPKSVARLLSSVLPPNTHLIDFFGRDGEIQMSTSTVSLPNATIAAPMYVLTSPDTFSGGEECAYDLQTHKRATLVGEVTGGGANPGGVQRIDDHFGIFVPDATPRSPITMANWEGTGVKPDVAVPAAQALVTAYDMALAAELHETTLSGDVRANVTAVDARAKGLADADILTDFGKPVSVSSWPAEVSVPPAILAEYAGIYQGVLPSPFVISVQGNHLGSKLGEQGVVPMFAESGSRFFAKVVDAEIEFFRDPATHAISHLTLYQNGREIEFARLSGSN